MGLNKSGFAIVGTSIVIGVLVIGGFKIADTVEASTRTDFGMTPCSVVSVTVKKEVGKAPRQLQFAMKCAGNSDLVTSHNDYRVSFEKPDIQLDAGNLLKCRVVESGLFGFMKWYKQYSYLDCAPTTPEKYLSGS